MPGSYIVRPLSSSEAHAAAQAWQDLAGGGLDVETLRRIEQLLREAGSDQFAAFAAVKDGQLCGVATAFHLRDHAASPVFWERIGFRPEKLRYTLKV